jgi:hypothetical protein
MQAGSRLLRQDLWSKQSAGLVFLRNVGELLPDYRTSHRRRCYSTLYVKCFSRPGLGFLSDLLEALLPKCCVPHFYG